MDVEESYANLSYKTLTAYRWILAQELLEGHIDWLIKTDDDIMVLWNDVLISLDEKQDQLSITNHTLFCHYVLRNRYPQRDPKDKL